MKKDLRVSAVTDDVAQESNQPREEWAALREEISKSEGARAHARINMLVRGHGILTANHADLAAALDFFDTPEALPLWDTDHPERLDHFMDHVTTTLSHRQCRWLTTRVTLLETTTRMTTPCASPTTRWWPVTFYPRYLSSSNASVTTRSTIACQRRRQL